MNPFGKIFGIFSAVMAVNACVAEHADENNDLTVNLRYREQTLDENAPFDVKSRTELWKPSETVVLISDMWDRHWCPEATRRVGELAVAMDKVLDVMREKGVTIVHAPSECLEFYENHPARVKIAGYDGSAYVKYTNGVKKLPSETGAVWPIYDKDEGCTDPEAYPHKVWSRINELVTVKDEDVISADGAQLGAYFHDKGIKNVIMMGVHTNMCVMHRTYGLRTMKRLGMNVVLMRDMTDLMYNPASWPYVSHWKGLDLMIEYIEKYVCPTVLSSEFTGGQPFVFSEAMAEQSREE